MNNPLADHSCWTTVEISIPHKPNSIIRTLRILRTSADSYLKLSTLKELNNGQIITCRSVVDTWPRQGPLRISRTPVCLNLLNYSKKSVVDIGVIDDIANPRSDDHIEGIGYHALMLMNLSVTPSSLKQMGYNALTDTLNTESLVGAPGQYTKTPFGALERDPEWWDCINPEASRVSRLFQHRLARRLQHLPMTSVGDTAAELGRCLQKVVGVAKAAISIVTVPPGESTADPGMCFPANVIETGYHDPYDGTLAIRIGLRLNIRGVSLPLVTVADRCLKDSIPLVTTHLHAMRCEQHLRDSRRLGSKILNKPKTHEKDAVYEILRRTLACLPGCREARFWRTSRSNDRLESIWSLLPGVSQQDATRHLCGGSDSNYTSTEARVPQAPQISWIASAKRTAGDGYDTKTEWQSCFEASVPDNVIHIVSESITPSDSEKVIWIGSHKPGALNERADCKSEGFVVGVSVIMPLRTSTAYTSPPFQQLLQLIQGTIKHFDVLSYERFQLRCFADLSAVASQIACREEDIIAAVGRFFSRLDPDIAWVLIDSDSSRIHRSTLDGDASHDVAEAAFHEAQVWLKWWSGNSPDDPISVDGYEIQQRQEMPPEMAKQLYAMIRGRADDRSDEPLPAGVVVVRLAEHVTLIAVKRGPKGWLCSSRDISVLRVACSRLRAAFSRRKYDARPQQKGEEAQGEQQRFADTAVQVDQTTPRALPIGSGQSHIEEMRTRLATLCAEKQSTTDVRKVLMELARLIRETTRAQAVAVFGYYNCDNKATIDDEGVCRRIVHYPLPKSKQHTVPLNGNQASLVYHDLQSSENVVTVGVVRIGDDNAFTVKRVSVNTDSWCENDQAFPYWSLIDAESGDYLVLRSLRRIDKHVLGWLVVNAGSECQQAKRVSDSMRTGYLNGLLESLEIFLQRQAELRLVSFRKQFADHLQQVRRLPSIVEDWSPEFGALYSQTQVPAKLLRYLEDLLSSQKGSQSTLQAIASKTLSVMQPSEEGVIDPQPGFVRITAIHARRGTKERTVLATSPTMGAALDRPTGDAIERHSIAKCICTDGEDRLSIIRRDDSSLRENEDETSRAFRCESVAYSVEACTSSIIDCWLVHRVVAAHCEILAESLLLRHQYAARADQQYVENYRSALADVKHEVVRTASEAADHRVSKAVNEKIDRVFTLYQALQHTQDSHQALGGIVGLVKQGSQSSYLSAPRTQPVYVWDLQDKQEVLWHPKYTEILNRVVREQCYTGDRLVWPHGETDTLQPNARQAPHLVVGVHIEEGCLVADCFLCWCQTLRIEETLIPMLLTVKVGGCQQRLGRHGNGDGLFLLGKLMRAFGIQYEWEVATPHEIFNRCSGMSSVIRGSRAGCVVTITFPSGRRPH